MHKINRAFLLILVISETCNAKIKPHRKPAPHHHEKQHLPVPTPKVMIEKVNKAQETIQTYWPKGVVYYFLDNFQYDYLIGRVLRSVFNYIETVSCVKFMPLINKPEKDEGYSYLYIANPSKEMKCVHAPVYNKNREIAGTNESTKHCIVNNPFCRNQVTIGYKCLQKREILHSILHGLGLRDEVTHPYRDQYVRVLWENIHPEYRHLFRLNTEDLQAKHISEYDPLSVMHFHDRAFSRNGRATIAPLMPGLLIQPSVELSQLDQLKLRMLFGHECNRREVGELLDTCKIAFHTESDNVKGHNGSHHGTKDNENGENVSNEGEGFETDVNAGVIVASDDVKNGTDGHGQVDHEVDEKGGASIENDLDEEAVHKPVGNKTVEVDGEVGIKSEGKGGASDKADGKAKAGDKADGKAKVGDKSDEKEGGEGAEKHEDGENKENEKNDGANEGVIVTEDPGKEVDGKKDNAVGNGRRRWWLQKWW